MFINIHTFFHFTLGSRLLQSLIKQYQDSHIPRSKCPSDCLLLRFFSKNDDRHCDSNREDQALTFTSQLQSSVRISYYAMFKVGTFVSFSSISEANIEIVLLFNIKFKMSG